MASSPAQGGDAPSLYGLSAFEVKAIAQELHRAAYEHSDGDDDYPLDVQIIAGVENDDGTVTQGPILCIRDSDHPEEGVYPIPVSQEVRDRYTHPSASVPEGGDPVAWMNQRGEVITDEQKRRLTSNQGIVGAATATNFSIPLVAMEVNNVLR